MERYIQREWIRFKGVAFNLSTTSIDWATWMNLYRMGVREPSYPVPAIRHEVVFPWNDAGYAEMIYVNDNGIEEDPLIVACWDFYYREPEEWRGKYQHCYIDVRARWYIEHGAWNALSIDRWE